MTTLHVVNIKCDGCAARITEKLEEHGLSKITVSPEKQTITFEGDADTAKQILTKMGYPEQGSAAANRLDKKAKSYVSCAIGRWG